MPLGVRRTNCCCAGLWARRESSRSPSESPRRWANVEYGNASVYSEALPRACGRHAFGGSTPLQDQRRGARRGERARPQGCPPGRTRSRNPAAGLRKADFGLQRDGIQEQCTVSSTRPRRCQTGSVTRTDWRRRRRPRRGRRCLPTQPRHTPRARVDREAAPRDRSSSASRYRIPDLDRCSRRREARQFHVARQPHLEGPRRPRSHNRRPEGARTCRPQAGDHRGHRPYRRRRVVLRRRTHRARLETFVREERVPASLGIGGRSRPPRRSLGESSSSRRRDPLHPGVATRRHLDRSRTEGGPGFRPRSPDHSTGIVAVDQAPLLDGHVE